VQRCQVAAQAFNGMSGTELKEFIYRTFSDEVSNLPLGTTIVEPRGADREG
jgi:hypothetical protein